MLKGYKRLRKKKDDVMASAGGAMYLPWKLPGGLPFDRESARGSNRLCQQLQRRPRNKILEKEKERKERRVGSVPTAANITAYRLMVSPTY